MVDDERSQIEEGDDVRTPHGATATVLEVYDDEFGTEGDVVATLVVDD